MRKDLAALMSKTFLIRGKMLSDTVYLERCMDEYMARYFCSTKDKQSDLMQSVFATKRMIFENKRLIFDYVVKKANPEFVKKHPTFKNDVIKIIEERNIMAHYLLDSSEEGIKDHHSEVRFINFKDGVEKVVYNEKKLNEISGLIERCINAVRELLG